MKTLKKSRIKRGFLIGIRVAQTDYAEKTYTNEATHLPIAISCGSGSGEREQSRSVHNHNDLCWSGAAGRWVSGSHSDHRRSTGGQCRRSRRILRCELQSGQGLSRRFEWHADGRRREWLKRLRRRRRPGALGTTELRPLHRAR